MGGEGGEEGTWAGARVGVRGRGGWSMVNGQWSMLDGG